MTPTIDMSELNPTHDPAARSWLASANAGDADFPIQNLPIAVFRPRTGQPAWRGGVAIGDQVIDLARALAAGLLPPALSSAAAPALNDYFALGALAWRELRHTLFAAFNADAATGRRSAWRSMLVPIADAEFSVPTRVANYTDFYTSIHHALNVGRIARPDAPLTPNFQWLPIAYHGRASSVVASGSDFHRPLGQRMRPGDAAPTHGPCERLDYELELAIWIGPGNALGTSITMADAEQHIAGVGLLNDWSARDIQFWEMAPLGPFLGKNFCTSVSPWVVSLEALAPFRLPFIRPTDHPQPLPYLDGAALRAAGAMDIQLSVSIATAAQRARGEAGTEVSRTSFRHQYWTPSQMLVQHTMGGCNLLPGDLLGSGTISGPTPSEAGAIIELTKAGREPLVIGGEARPFLADGDQVSLRGWCEKPGARRIGLGACVGTVLPVR